MAVWHCQRERTTVHPNAIRNLIQALDEWEAADDAANEAAAALSSPTPLSPDELREMRELQRIAAEKLEAVRRLIEDDSRSSN